MWHRRIAYLAALLGCLVFYGFYQEWFSWIALLAVAYLPWFSLLLSLPAMHKVKAGLRCPQKVRLGVPVHAQLQLQSKFPVPPVSGKIRLYNSLTDACFVSLPGKQIPTDHCGMMTVSYDQLFVYDYLGLFRRRLRQGDKSVMYIEPKPVSTDRPPELAGGAVNVWKPKHGGGFSENHDLRLYRPGDDLRHIHWKMAAKTGKLIYREPVEPVQKGCMLTLTLTGTADILDKKLGQLLWLSSHLLARHIAHEVRCHTGKGPVAFSVNDEASLEAGIHALLSSTPAREEVVPQKQDALWKQHIGGDGDEA